MIRIKSFLLIYLSFFAATNLLAASVYEFNKTIQTFGNNEFINAVYEDTLVDIARKYNLGFNEIIRANPNVCLLYTSPSPRDRSLSRMPSSA